MASEGRMDVAIVDPEREFWAGEAYFLVARTEDGEIGILPQHAPFLGVLRHARLMVEVDPGGERVEFAVHGGFLMVKDNKVSVLARVAELSTEIDVARAERAKAKAEEALRANEEDASAKQALLRAETRLNTAAGLGMSVG